MTAATLPQSEKQFMGSSLSFTVVGKPETAGSKRAFRNPRTGALIVTDDNSRTKSWQGAVAQAAADAMDGRPLYDGPLRVQMIFYRTRPRGHYGTGRNALQVKRSAPDYPTTRPDVLKLARAAEDALTGVIWRDDAQLVDERLFKEWGEPARLEVFVLPATNSRRRAEA